jgi:predicted ATPase
MSRKVPKASWSPTGGHYVRRLQLIQQELIDWNNYPFSIPSVQSLHDLDVSQPVTIFVGENGSGKSTIIEALAKALKMNPEGGSKSFNFRTASTDSLLSDHLRALRNPSANEEYAFFLRAETMYNVFTQDEIYKATDYLAMGLELPMELRGKGAYHTRSHGESFHDLITTRFSSDGVYLLDEPESALSPQKQLETLKFLHQLAFKQSSQLFIATHSPILTAIPGAVIYELGENGIQRVTYEETHVYRTYWAFMKDYRAFLHHLEL